jgi:uncharacterized membrane protein (UPF0127 family)
MTRIRRSRLIAGAALAAAAIGSVHAQAISLPTIKLSAGINLITAEVATTQGDQATGLMYREQLPGNAGMLFVFDDKRLECMWMRNTLIPLSVAFINDDGSIVNIEDMKAQTDDSHCAKVPVHYALEMGLGWFAKRGIVPPTGRISGLPPVKAQ